MTWDELKEEAKKITNRVFDDFICVGLLYFDKNGEILMSGATVVKNRTPDQMWQIMEALK